MKRFRYYQAILLAGFLCAGYLQSSAESKIAPLTDAEKQAALFAVARVGDYVVAGNSEGMFRAKNSTKVWERVPLPGQIKPLGQLAASTANSNTVFLCVRGAIYQSDDSGATWRLISKELNFESVFQNQDGKIYAITEELKKDEPKEGVPPNKGYLWWSIVVSDNDGQSWRDIKSDIAPGVMLTGISPDPASPKRVCLRGNCMRDVVLQATDDNYTKWNMKAVWNWESGKKSGDDLFCEGYAATSPFYIFKANLANYFDHDFGNSPDLPAFEIRPQTNNFTFSARDEVTIPIQIHFLPAGETVKLADMTEGVQFWRFECITPAGNRIEASGTTNKFVSPEDFEALKPYYRQRPDFKVMDLASDQPYNREVILSRMFEFTQTGTYRVHLLYDSITWGSKQGTNGQNTSSDFWGGTFTSPIFTVTIKP